MKKIVVMILTVVAFAIPAEAKNRSKAHGAIITCPSDITGVNCDYYKDGYKLGVEDRRANLSDSYERHSDKYDSRFEPPFRSGFEAGYNSNH
jgi:hypothetical protein